MAAGCTTTEKCDFLRQMWCVRYTRAGFFLYIFILQLYMQSTAKRTRFLDVPRFDIFDSQYIQNPNVCQLGIIQYVTNTHRIQYTKYESHSVQQFNKMILFQAAKVFDFGMGKKRIRRKMVKLKKESRTDLNVWIIFILSTRLVTTMFKC